MNIHILVIDHNPEIKEAVEFEWAKYHCDLTWVDDFALAATELSESEKEYSLIAVKREHVGEALVATLKLLRKMTTIPIIILSTEYSADAKLSCLGLGADAFLCIPETLEEGVATGYGYGTQRICNYLAENGMTTREGNRFTNTTIQNILKRPIYIGILSAGGVQSNVLPELQIIPQEVFERTQEILKERSLSYADRRIPMNTKGNALLSGNVFCGHCNARLTLTTNGKKYVRKDGGVTVTPKMRYVCYNKTRHPEKCDGQTGYTTSKLDGVVEKVVESIFARIKEQPGEQIIEAQFEERISAVKLNLDGARTALNGELQVLSMLEDELIKVLHGTSALKPDLLNRKHDEAERSVTEKKAIVDALEQELAGSQDTMRQVTRQYNDVLTWAGMYAESPMDVKKMIVAQLIREVRVSRDYKIEIDFKISEKQLGLDQEYQAEVGPKQKKHRDEPAL